MGEFRINPTIFPFIPPHLPPLRLPPSSPMLQHGSQRSDCRPLHNQESEGGRANIILALASELPSRPGTEVHVASFAALEKRVAALRDVALPQPSSSSLMFHTIHGVDMNTAPRQRGIKDEDLIHSPTTKFYKAYDTASTTVTAWTCEGARLF